MPTLLQQITKMRLIQFEKQLSELPQALDQTHKSSKRSRRRHHLPTFCKNKILNQCYEWFCLVTMSICTTKNFISNPFLQLSLSWRSAFSPAFPVPLQLSQVQFRFIWLADTSLALRKTLKVPRQELLQFTCHFFKVIRKLKPCISEVFVEPSTWFYYHVLLFKPHFKSPAEYSSPSFEIPKRGFYLI